MNRAAPLSALSLIAALACEATPPDVDNQPSQFADAGGSTYADLVVSYTEGGEQVSCTDNVAPLCETQTGVCADHPVFGAPDNRSITLVGPASLEVGFLCHPILDRAPGSELGSDFVVRATIDQGSGGVVSVSEDGSSYLVLDFLSRDDQAYDLAIREIEYARFVRIAVDAGSTVTVDAIEAFA